MPRFTRPLASNPNPYNLDVCSSSLLCSRGSPITSAHLCRALLLILSRCSRASSPYSTTEESVISRTTHMAPVGYFKAGWGLPSKRWRIFCIFPVAEDSLRVQRYCHSGIRPPPKHAIHVFSALTPKWHYLWTLWGAAWPGPADTSASSFTTAFSTPACRCGRHRPSSWRGPESCLKQQSLRG